MQDIVSKNNSSYKQLLKRMAQPRLLRKEGLAVVEGLHGLEMVLNWRQVQLQEVWIGQGLACHPQWLSFLPQLQDIGVPIWVLPDHLYHSASDLENCLGPLLLFHTPKSVVDVIDAKPDSKGDWLLLDGVQDPGNVGVLMRTAAAAGVSRCIVTPDCAWPFSTKVMRAAMGSHSCLDIVTLNNDVVQWLSNLKSQGVAIRVSTLEASSSLYHCDLSGPGVWVFGNEGQGVRADVKLLATQSIHIPQAVGVESLNVASAAAVCLFEQKRQRLVLSE